MMEKRAGPGDLGRPHRRLRRPRSGRRRDGRSALRERPGGQQRGVRRLANDLARQLATGPGAATPEELLAQPSPSKPGRTLQAAVRRPEQPHPRGLQASSGSCGSTARAAATPITTARPACCCRSKAATPSWPRTSACTWPPCGPRWSRQEDLDPAAVAKEREILTEARPQGRQAREDHRQDGRGPAAELLRRVLPGRAAVRQGRSTRARRSARWPRKRA